VTDTDRPTVPSALEQLDRAASVAEAADNELLAAIAGVLRDFLENYDTFEHMIRCSHCADNVCSRAGSALHQSACQARAGLHLHHGGCRALVEECECLAPYLLLARRVSA
jgi:hypothetical protein